MGNHAGSTTRILPRVIKKNTHQVKLHWHCTKSGRGLCGYNGPTTLDRTKLSCGRCMQVLLNADNQAKDERRIA